MNNEGDIPKNERPSCSRSKEPIFLYGDLDLWILEARSLPNLDMHTETMRKCFTMGNTFTPPFMKASKSNNGKTEKGSKSSKSSSMKNYVNTSDPYVSVVLSGATVAQTRIVRNCENPSWDEHFIVPVAHPADKVEFVVKDEDVLGAELIGVVEIPVQEVLTGNTISDWFPISGGHADESKSPELRISIQYKPFGESPSEKSGIGAGADYTGIPNTYFPLRKGGKVTLYQDAHVPDACLPTIPLDEGKVFKQGTCWEDICHAILEAQHLVYIIGWSVYHPIKLVREPTKPLPSGGELSLGDLLKFKSQEGVRVIMLIWDDKTSHDNFLIKTEGLMQTHDEETKKFFKHSTVHCVLAPRYASNKLSIFKQQVVGTLYTHHQKCVILDTHAIENKRKIIAFIGGLDLCDGRYDTPEHRLYRDLDTVYHNDCYNPMFPPDAGGPREPWHDLHCKVEGPAAYDILTNFEQRWRKARKWRDFKLKKVTSWNDDALLKIDRISWILKPSTGAAGDKVVQVTDEDDPESWNVQVFRSIDSGSVQGFPKDVDQAKAQHLLCGKNLKVDKSIHTAYVKAIRSAQHFVYIENQYFLGSSYHWPSYENAGAHNLVPMELALKIASKISANERFCVYVVIPMWPEGLPTSNAVQEILFWQGQTMSMMYGVVADALKKAGLSNHPKDYLNFYCLGKREPQTFDTSTSTQSFDNRALASVNKYRRLMIYVHAKGMIIDDQFVLMGSANINQRSLDGSRDTEIAMGAYQPKYTWAGKQSHPHGQVYGYRMSLWAEHLGCVEDCLKEPQNLECVRRVNEIAESNWSAFVSEQDKELKGHLMMYPVHVGHDGKVTSLKDWECFPDLGGKILGSPNSLPDTLTT